MDGYRALLIGNSTFPADAQNLQDLHGPVKDVAALAAALTDRDTGLFDSDHVALLVERPAAKILEETEAFFLEARRDDQLLLYYSGHGLLDERNQLYLAAANTRVDRLRSTAVGAADISEMLDSSAARTAVILLDCCHSGAFKGNIGPANLAGSGRFVLTSCRSGALANDADRRNGTSLFTQHLVDGLMGGVVDLDADGRVDVDEVYRYVHERLAAANRQIPQRRFDGSARTPALARRPVPAAVPPPPPLPPPPAAPVTPAPDGGGNADLTMTGTKPMVPVTPPPPEATPEPQPATPRGRFGGPRRRWALGGTAVLAVLVVAFLLVAVVGGDDPSSGPTPLPAGRGGLSSPSGLFLEPGGPGSRDDSVLVADTGRNRVVRVDVVDGELTTVAGTGESGPFVEGVPANEAVINGPSALARLPDGTGVIVDQEGARLLAVAPDGKVRTLRPEGPLSASPGPITSILATPDGGLFIAKETRVLLLDLATRTLTPVAGTDVAGSTGDGGPATSAQLQPWSLALEPEGRNLYVADCSNNRVRKVDLGTRQIQTVAGNPERSYEEGGRATDGGLSCPGALAFDPDGALYMIDGGRFVRKVQDQVITTVAGRDLGPAGYTEDGQPASATTFQELRGLAVDGEKRLYLIDGDRLRSVDPASRVVSTMA